MSKIKHLPYRKDLKLLARKLRNNSTLAEVLLWCKIKGKALEVEFHRQVPIGNYIVDFYCHELMLAIEIDGNSHYDEVATEKDVTRQRILENLGICFIRFDDAIAIQNIPFVLQELQLKIDLLR